MKALRAALLVLLLLVLAVAGWGAYTLSNGADLGFARQWLAEKLTTALARPVHIDGGVTLTLGRNVTLEIGDLTIANTAWGRHPHLARAARLLVAADLRSLWDGPVVIRRLELAGTSVFMEHSDKDEVNWDLGPDDGEPLDPDSLPLIDVLTLAEASIRYDTRTLTRPVELRLAEASARREASGFLRLAANGTVNEGRLTLHAQSSPLAVLLRGRDVSLRLRADVDGVDVRAAARFDDVADPERALADVRIAADDAARVGALLGLPDPGAGPLRVDASITPQEQKLQLRLNGTAGAYGLRLDGTARRLTTLAGLDLDLSGQGPDFNAIAALLGWKDAPGGVFEVAGRLRSEGATLHIEQATIELADLTFALAATIDDLPQGELRKLSVQVRGAQIERFLALLELPAITDGRFKFTARVDEDALGADQVELGLEHRAGQFRATGTLGPLPEFYGSDLRLTGNGPSLAVLGRIAGTAILPAAAFQLEAQLRWVQDGLRLGESWLTAGGERLDVSGRIARAPLGPGTEISGRLTGRSLRATGERLGAGKLPPVSYEVDATLTRQRNSTQVRNLRMTTADTRLNLEGTIPDQSGAAGAVLRIEAEGDALQSWQSLGRLPLPAGAFAARGGLALERDAVALRDMDITLAGASGRVNGRVARALDSGSFDLGLQGPALARLLPGVKGIEKFVTAFDLSARGEWRGQRWTLRRAWLKAGADELQASGVLDAGAEAAVTAMPVTLRLGSLARAGELAGLRLPDLPLRVEGNLTGTARRFSVAGLHGELAGAALAGSLAFAAGKPPEVTLDLSLVRLDLAAFATPAGSQTPAAPPPAGGRLIPDWPLPIAWLGKLNAGFDLHFGDLQEGPIRYGAVRLQGQLRNRALRLDRATLNGRAGRADLQARLDAAGTTPRLAIRGELRNFATHYGTLAQLSSDPRRFDVDLQLTGTGTTLRQLLAQAEGRVRVVGGPGRIPTSVLDSFYGDTISQLLNTINPFRRSEPLTNSVCTVLPLQIKAGVASTAPTIVTLTDKLNVIAFGTVNLASERLNLSFRTEARRGIGVSAGQIVNPFIRVTGSLTEPRVTIDPRGATITGTAAILTGGMSIVATTLWNRAFRERDPCAAVLREADRLADSDPDALALAERVDRFFR